MSQRRNQDFLVDSNYDLYVKMCDYNISKNNYFNFHDDVKRILEVK